MFSLLFNYSSYVQSVINFQQGLPQAKKQRIAEEEEIAERDCQLRFAADQEAKVSNVVVFIVYATHL